MQTFLATTPVEPRELLESLPAIAYVIPTEFTKPPTYLSSAVVTIVGYSAEEFYDNPGLWASVVHPDDRPWVFDYWRKAICQARSRFSAEYRVVRRDGDVCWLRDEAHVPGRAHVAFGVMTPVSGDKLASFVTPPHADAVAELRDLKRMEDDLDRRVAGAVQRARRQGRSWQEIGRSLGVTRQAALARFGKTIED